MADTILFQKLGTFGAAGPIAIMAVRVKSQLQQVSDKVFEIVKSVADKELTVYFGSGQIKQLREKACHAGKQPS